MSKLNPRDSWRKELRDAINQRVAAMRKQRKEARSAMRKGVARE